MAERAREWRKAHPEKKRDRREWAKRHRTENPEQYREAFKAYRVRPGNLEKIMLHQSRSRAKLVGLDHDIELEDIVIPEFCPYLGIKIARNNKAGPAESSPALDRIDNSLGYVKGNVQVLSYKANRMKNNATAEELLMFADAVIRAFRPLDPRDID